MTLLTLRELNRDFLAENASRHQGISNKTIYLPLPGPDSISTEAAREVRLADGPRADQRIQSAERTPSESRRHSFALVSDIVFYLVVILILLYVFVTGVDSGVPRTFLGYSYFSVVSRSMQEEIPKGSFILVHRVDDLKVGDTITFMRDSTTSVTHKITDIYENYRYSGARGYQTKGIHNTYPDEAVVYDANVVGKVILVIPGLGAAMTFLAGNIVLVLLLYGFGVALSFLIRGFLVKSQEV